MNPIKITYPDNKGYYKELYKFARTDQKKTHIIYIVLGIMTIFCLFGVRYVENLAYTPYYVAFKQYFFWFTFIFVTFIIFCLIRHVMIFPQFIYDEIRRSVVIVHSATFEENSVMLHVWRGFLTEEEIYEYEEFENVSIQYDSIFLQTAKLQYPIFVAKRHVDSETWNQLRKLLIRHKKHATKLSDIGGSVNEPNSYFPQH